MRYDFVIIFFFVPTFDPVDRVKKEETDRTLLGPIQFTAVYCIGITTIHWYRLVFENDTTFLGYSKTLFHITVYSIVLV
jgi:hypothetical protein